MTTYNISLLEKLARRELIMAGAKREPSLVDRICAKVSSDHDKERYPWIGDAPVMELLQGELISAGLSDAVIEIVNNTYAISIEVPRNDLKDDQVGGHMKRVGDMATVALNFPNKLVANALINGTSLLGFDGVSFFNDAHPIRGVQPATQDNLLAGSGVTTANIMTDLNTGMATLRRFLGEHGDPVSDQREKFCMVGPPELMRPFKEAVGAPIVSQTSNVFLNGVSVDIFTTSRLSDSNDWYLFSIDGAPSMPLIYQENEGVTTEVLAEGSDHYVKKEKAMFKVRWRGAVGYGHWATAVKFVN